MIKIAEVQFYPWDKTYDFYFDNQQISVGDFVLVNTELGSDIGKIINTREEADDKYILLENESTATSDASGKASLKPVVRLATADDLQIVEDYQEEEGKLLNAAKQIVQKMNLSMKLVAANSSFDGGRVTFAFIADGRVDFRDLVKELIRHFRKTIRLQQLGARDEAKIVGDCGHCGRELCCKKSLQSLTAVNSDLPFVQQIGHRGSERLSGACGRLMCCLRYENDTYVELAKNMPAIGSKIATPQGEGVVIGWHTLKQTVDVRIGEDRSNIVEVDVKK